MLKWKRVCHTLEAFYFCQIGIFFFCGLQINIVFFLYFVLELISLLLSSRENGIESRTWIERLLCFLLAAVLFLSKC